MDKLAKQMKADAAKIEVQVSDELEQRITASLRAVSPVKPKPAVIQQRPATFWWASSLTGIAAALVVIAVINSHSQPRDTDVPLAGNTTPTSVPNAIMGPAIDWKTESAMVTRPLQKELLDLQSDIKKAEEIVKREIGL